LYRAGGGGVASGGRRLTPFRHLVKLHHPKDGLFSC
jgi:hypothetical protein